MDQVQKTLEPCKEFVKDSVRLVKRCTKPDRKGEPLFGLNFNQFFRIMVKALILTYLWHYLFLTFEMRFYISLLLRN